MTKIAPPTMLLQLALRLASARLRRVARRLDDAADIINALKVGDLAPNAFGRMAEVVEIVCKRDDIEGKRFVMYYTANGENSTMSMSIKEGRLVRHAGLRRTSAELDAIERSMLVAGDRTRAA